ncbi:MAG: hypothetical protein HQL23_07430 [Candidatus Omnitrophica bacterium]|nr:hypothetical protein [Candidatus Omnitrophota bacterium]
MKRFGRDVYIWCAAVGLTCGCAAAGRQRPLVREPKTDAQTMAAVAESVAGKPLSEKEIQRIANDLRQNSDARSAVGMITNTMQGEGIKAKYSPVTGKRYAPHLDIDPETGVKLLPVE